jgi:hypothetical protein
VTDNAQKTLGRNDPCHCGSGKKYKQCCLQKDEDAARAARQKEQESAAAAEAPAAPADAEAERGGPRHEPRHKTPQPWKRGQDARAVPRFNAPRRSGGS